MLQHYNLNGDKAELLPDVSSSSGETGRYSEWTALGETKSHKNQNNFGQTKLSNTHGMACIQAFIHQFNGKNAINDLMSYPSILFPTASGAEVAANWFTWDGVIMSPCTTPSFRPKAEDWLVALIKISLCKYKCNNISVYLCDWQQTGIVRLSAHAGTT